jgi:hypothetical protein
MCHYIWYNGTNHFKEMVINADLKTSHPNQSWANLPSQTLYKLQRRAMYPPTLHQTYYPNKFSAADRYSLAKTMMHHPNCQGWMKIFHLNPPDSQGQQPSLRFNYTVSPFFAG